MNSTKTYILTRHQECTMTIQGFVMFPKMRDYMLPDNYSFQDYFPNDVMFKNTMVLLHGDGLYDLITVWTDSNNETLVNTTCQEINMLLYKILSTSGSN